MQQVHKSTLLFCRLCAAFLLLCGCAAAAFSAPRPPLLLVHYMPWFQAPPVSPQYGWHWTMNHYHPEQTQGSSAGIASHYMPLMGPYDSDDPIALKCQILLMKMSGIQGVVFDWYGTTHLYDYAGINQNVLHMVPLLQQAGMKFALCFEDQTIRSAIAAHLYPAASSAARASAQMRYMQKNYFSSPAYIHLNGRPLLLTFGAPYFNSGQWNHIFSTLPQKPVYLTENTLREPGASEGAFDWPLPADGTAAALQLQQVFFKNAASLPYSLPAAYPRFHDIYAEAGVGKSWGRIRDNSGKTYVLTLTRALQSHSFAVQIVTWNDWGEGTMIEPSVQYRYRDLDATRRLLQSLLQRTTGYSRADLRLPIAWYRLCSALRSKPAELNALQAFFPLALAHHMRECRQLLQKYR